MILFQMTGLSGAGKTTLAENALIVLRQHGYQAEVIDGDVYRKTLCSDLGFSKEDRLENIRRLGEIAGRLIKENSIVILSAINPYEEGRLRLCKQYGDVRTIWVDCPLHILETRDTKGLYKRAQLPIGHPERVNNLTGVNDPFEIPRQYDLKIDTGVDDVAGSTEKLTKFILSELDQRTILSSSFPLYRS